MPATIIPFTSATSLFELADKRNSASTAQRTRRTRVKSIDEPETRLWKLFARQHSRWEAIVELIIFAVFVFIALALVACFVEVEQRTDVICQAAVEVIQK